jgi:hypothetical protein
VATFGVGNERCSESTLIGVFFFEYIYQGLLTSLNLEEPDFHGDNALVNL